MDIAYDVVDYSNLQCIDNYIYDSGWKFTGRSGFAYLDLKTSATYRVDWNYINAYCICDNSISCISSDGFTYIKGAYQSEDGSAYLYQVKQTQPRTSYKSFSSF